MTALTDDKKLRRQARLVPVPGGRRRRRATRTSRSAAATASLHDKAADGLRRLPQVHRQRRRAEAAGQPRHASACRSNPAAASAIQDPTLQDGPGVRRQGAVHPDVLRPGAADERRRRRSTTRSRTSSPARAARRASSTPSTRRSRTSDRSLTGPCRRNGAVEQAGRGLAAARRPGARHPARARRCCSARRSLLFVGFVLLPIGVAVYYSLYEWNGFGPLDDFVGLRQLPATRCTDDGLPAGARCTT